VKGVRWRRRIKREKTILKTAAHNLNYRGGQDDPATSRFVVDYIKKKKINKERARRRRA